MAAQYYISITRWQHNIKFQSPDGSIILRVNPQIAAQYYILIILITRWFISWVNPEMAAPYYIPITR